MPSNTQDLLQAYEKGKEASQALMQRIDAYLATRGGQFLKAFLPALEGRLHGLLTQESTAPELMAQQAWLEFLREIAQTEGELLTETPARLSDVFEAAKAIGIRPQLDQYLRQEVDMTCRRAGLHGSLLVVKRLDATLMAKGRPPLVLASAGEELKGLQTAYAMARVASTTARTILAEYLEQRLVPLEERYLDVFRQQLANARESTSHPPILVAEADLKVFRNQVHDIPPKIRAELQEHLGEWYSIAEQGGFRSALDDLVEERLMKTVASMEAEGERLFHAAK